VYSKAPTAASRPSHQRRPPPISYARSLPLSKALKPEVLIAYQMNGRDLRPDHGYPVRVIVPGHFGMASVTWLTRIEALRAPFQRYWQTTDAGTFLPWRFLLWNIRLGGTLKCSPVTFSFPPSDGLQSSLVFPSGLARPRSLRRATGEPSGVGRCLNPLKVA
jgi:hypothetical protein